MPNTYRLYPLVAENMVYYLGSAFQIDKTNLVAFLCEDYFQDSLESLHKMQVDMLRPLLHSAANLSQYNKLISLYKIYAPKFLAAEEEVLAALTKRWDELCYVLNKPFNNEDGSYREEPTYCFVKDKALYLEREQVGKRMVDQRESIDILKDNIKLLNEEVKQYAERIDKLRSERKGSNPNVFEKFVEMK